MNFLRNTWYMAAWAEEVGQGMLARTLLGEPVLMFRRPDGAAVALGNRCAHRFAPLSDGQLADGEVRCPYHGLKYNSEGVCTENPHGTHKIPAGMRVPTYPLVERHSILWIWMGSDAADASAIPDFSVLDESQPLRTIRRHLAVDADYRLITDNLLDLTHIVYVHTGIGGAALLENESNRSEQEGQTVWSRRRNEAITAAPAYRAFEPAFADMKVDKLQNMRWDAPANLLLEIVHHETGKPDSYRRVNYGGNLLTPESARRSHYFWSASRNYGLDNATLDERIEQAVTFAFASEDKPIIEAQQRMMDLAMLDDLRPVLIETDVASTRARRVLNERIAQELAAAGKPAIPIHPASANLGG